MLRAALGILGLLLGFGLGKECYLLSGPSAAGAVVLLVVWPILCGGGLVAGANLGSYLGRLSHRQPSEATARRPWLIRCLGLVQSGVAVALVVAVACIFSSAEASRQGLGPAVAWPALVLVAAPAWLLLLKGWFELLTGVGFGEWPSFWRQLSFGGKLAWAGGYCGCGVLLLLVPALLLVRLVTAF